MLKINYGYSLSFLLHVDVQTKLSISTVNIYDTCRCINNEMQGLFLITRKGCSTPGQYGSNCSKRCPDNCQEKNVTLSMEPVWDVHRDGLGSIATTVSNRFSYMIVLRWLTHSIYLQLLIYSVQWSILWSGVQYKMCWTL